MFSSKCWYQWDMRAKRTFKELWLSGWNVVTWRDLMDKKEQREQSSQCDDDKEDDFYFVRSQAASLMGFKTYFADKDLINERCEREGRSSPLLSVDWLTQTSCCCQFHHVMLLKSDEVLLSFRPNSCWVLIYSTLSMNENWKYRERMCWSDYDSCNNLQLWLNHKGKSSF